GAAQVDVLVGPGGRRQDDEKPGATHPSIFAELGAAGYFFVGDFLATGFFAGALAAAGFFAGFAGAFLAAAFLAAGFAALAAFSGAGAILAATAFKGLRASPASERARSRSFAGVKALSRATKSASFTRPSFSATVETSFSSEP